MKIFLVSSLFFVTFTVFAQGPYAPSIGQTGTTAIHKDSTVFVSWASAVTITRGLQDISNASLGYADVGTSASAVGKSGVNGIVSLGDGGSATLTFNAPIINGSGADFAIFENSFSDSFLELAFVEVSSDGLNFFRFDAVSLTDTIIQTGSFGSTDATDIYNLAGKYRAQYGTPFDLDELDGIAGLDINNITHVKIIDVVGSLNPLYATYDSQNRAVNDPWPTPFGSSGFDLDAVGVINSSATAIKEKNDVYNISFYPNPASNTIYFNVDSKTKYEYRLTTINGREIENGLLNNQLDISYLETGIYFIHISSGDEYIVKKLIKK